MAYTKTVFTILGMHCASCAVAIEQALKNHAGVREVLVRYPGEEGVVVYDTQKISETELISLINSLGYRVTLSGGPEEKRKSISSFHEHEMSRLWLRLMVGLIGLGFLILIAVVSPWYRIPHIAWFEAIIATVVQFFVGSRFYISTWQALRHRAATMDTLIALGTTVAYSYSLFSLLFEQFLHGAGLPTYRYFDASVAIITFIVLGGYLETRARKYTSQAIEKLMSLQPETALVRVERNGVILWEHKSIDSVLVGDMIRILPGDRIPVDGVISDGSSSIDESMITGESKPLSKKKGDSVIGATINISGSFEMSATRIGENTMLSRIIDLVKKAQASRAPVQKLVDTISSVFVPIVILLSLATFLVWFNIGPSPQLVHALVNMVSVLIIACPCALGLATPMSIMVGVGRGALQGVLIKDVQTLEQAGRISAVIFDKTGTLTEGKQTICDVQYVENFAGILKNQGWRIPLDVLPELYLLALIALVEERSNHPVSLAVLSYIKKKYAEHETLVKGLSILQLQAVSGLGVRATIDGHTLTVGSQRLMEQEKIEVNIDVSRHVEEWLDQGKTVSFVAIDQKLVFYFSVSDQLRSSAYQAIDRLKEMKIKTALVTGDNEKTAYDIAHQLGIDDVFARVLPEEKTNKVYEMKKRGYFVAMVGDGINDAPALAAADVGIAVTSGTDVALEAAGVTLLHNNIELVPFTIRLSRAAMRNIRQNLVWAFGYNVLLIPVAMGVLYPIAGILLHPIFAGAAMALSSLSVVLNALRLWRVSLN